MIELFYPIQITILYIKVSGLTPKSSTKI